MRRDRGIRRLGRYWGCLLVAMMILPAWADQHLTDVYHLVRGGKLYDNWAVTLKIKPPKTNHPAYPATGGKKGADTWRCKECHGWDYKGANGRYAKGEHATGIVGIRAWQDKTPDQVMALLRNQTHQYTPAMISDEAARQLALFVTKGQIDMDPVIDPVTGKIHGEARHGSLFYQTICHVCHGLDGRKINLGTELEPEYLGTAAQENPWEILHKIRFGQPGHDMIATLALSLQDQADILAYLQTLPNK